MPNKERYRKNPKLCKHHSREYYRRHRKEWNAYQREYYRKRKLKLQKIVGMECILCGSIINIVFHEIHGKRHCEDNYVRNFKYILSHKEDFVSMCRTCHSILHSSARVKINLKTLKQYLSLLLGLDN